VKETLVVQKLWMGTDFIIVYFCFFYVECETTVKIVI